VDAACLAVERVLVDGDDVGVGEGGPDIGRHHGDVVACHEGRGPRHPGDGTAASI
jgi:hypothetical protein